MSLIKAFIGNLKDIKKTVVVSPVFYPNKFGLKGERTPVGNIIVHSSFSYIKTYPSSCWIYDTVLCLKKTKAEKIIFIGTAGALSNKLKIGDIVTAKNKYGLLRSNALAMTPSASNVIASRRRSNPRNNLKNIPLASVKSFNSLLDETKENLKKFTPASPPLNKGGMAEGYDAVDLETESFYKACKEIKKEGLAILVIQDKPLSKPFYKPLSQKDDERLRDGIIRLFEICKNLSNI
jgi:purine-nucleoside phosphorylase